MTVTLNPAIDRTLWVPGFAAGGTLVVERSSTVAGGKGVNVSRALRRFGIESIATGFIGREGNAPYQSMLDGEDIRHDFVSVAGAPRTNVTIISGAEGPETHLREKGPFVAPNALEQLEKKLAALLAAPEARAGSAGRPESPPCAKSAAHSESAPCAKGAGRAENTGRVLVVLSGGLPPGLGPDAYARLIELVHGCGAAAAFDASGEPLRAGLAARPDLIKPNAQEVAESLGFHPRSDGDVARAVACYHDAGVETVMISLGRGGLAFSRGDRAVHARVAVDKPLNSVGSGDAALAGALAGMLSGLSDEDVAALACAAGAANTLVSGACVFRLEDVERLFAEVELRAI